MATAAILVWTWFLTIGLAVSAGAVAQKNDPTTVKNPTQYEQPK